MRLKDPFSLKAADMTKRTNKPRKPRDEESSDEVSGKSLKQYKTPDGQTRQVNAVILISETHSCTFCENVHQVIYREHNIGFSCKNSFVLFVYFVQLWGFITCPTRPGKKLWVNEAPWHYFSCNEQSCHDCEILVGDCHKKLILILNW